MWQFLAYKLSWFWRFSWKKGKFHLNLTLFSLFTNWPNMVLCTVKYQYHTSWHIVVSRQFDELEGTVPSIWIGVIYVLLVLRTEVWEQWHIAVRCQIWAAHLRPIAPLSIIQAATIRYQLTTLPLPLSTAAGPPTLASNVYLSELNVCILTKKFPRLPCRWTDHTYKTKH